MSRYIIPKNSGPFYIITSKAGSPLIWNKKTSKGKVLISCKNENQAKEILIKLEKIKNGGEIWA